MALPIIAAAAARAGAAGARGARGAGGLMGGGGEKPKAMSTEGVTMLMLAAVLEFVNIIIGILDFVIIGIILGPIVNLAGTILIGGWLWMKTGKMPLKKGLGPLVGNSIPLAKFIPWWLIAVATSLDWKGGSAQEQPQQEEPQNTQEQPQQTQQAPT